MENATDEDRHGRGPFFLWNIGFRLLGRACWEQSARKVNETTADENRFPDSMYPQKKCVIPIENAFQTVQRADTSMHFGESVDCPAREVNPQSDPGET